MRGALDRWRLTTATGRGAHRLGASVAPGPPRIFKGDPKRINKIRTIKYNIKSFIQYYMVMARTTPDVRGYLLSTLGTSFSAPKRLMHAEKRLPLAIRGRYRLESTRLLDVDLVLAVESAGLEVATPAAYAAHLATIATTVQAPVVLVLTGVNSTTRARLVAGRVPFIVPGSQLFLPTLFVDLRERMTRPAPRRTETLGNVAQLVVLAHLQGEKMDQRSLAQAANRLGYSPMMLTKAKDELVAAGLCRARYEGRTLRLVFDVDGRELWNKAFPVLSSPVIRTHFVKFVSKVRASDPPVGFVRAGLTAVGDLTELAEGRVPTFAASKTVFASKSRSFVSVEFEDDADARVEVWRHSPDVLGRGGCADPLSLYLSLHGTADERLRKALDDVLKTVRW